jgi:hypothetical protein
VAYPVEGKVFSMAVADFDGDSIRDLATVVNDGQRLVIHRRTSAGFGPEPFHPAVTQATANPEYGPLVTADFDGDGILDVATLDTSSTRVSVFKGLGAGGIGTGAFGASSVTPVSGGKQLVAGDFNEDGAADLAVLAGAQVLVLLGNPGGALAAPIPYTLGVPSGSAAEPVLLTGDFNGDGVLDLLGQHRPTAYANQRLDTLAVLLGRGTEGRGDGTFEAPVALPISTEARGIYTPDLNGDGRSDLVVSANVLTPSGHGWRTELRVLLAGAGGSALFGPYTAYPVTIYGRLAAVNDFNADGVLDILPLGSPSESLSEILYGVAEGGVPTGTFTSSRTLKLGASYHSTGALAMTDVDGDGAFDLLLPGQNSLQVVRRAPGAGVSLQLHRIYTVPGAFYGFAMRDLNQDGVMDVVMTNGRLVVMLGRRP